MKEKEIYEKLYSVAGVAN